MRSEDARALLEKFRAGKIDAEEVLRAFQVAPAVDLGFACVDTHRALRKGFPEVVFGTGKTVDQVLGIVSRLYEESDRLLITRVSERQGHALCERFTDARYHTTASCVTLERQPQAKRPGTVMVVSAGTSDLPVAEEAVVTADIMGNAVDSIRDVGVAGLHRLLDRLETIHAANVIIAVAGMEGALPSLVAGLLDKPVIAVPTSIGYGASFGGLAALLGMLNSCGSGVTVVNIDNGFGAAYAASQINALAS